MNIQINQLTDAELQSAILTHTIQREINASNISILTSELLKREQTKQATPPPPSDIKLPALKKINMPPPKTTLDGQSKTTTLHSHPTVPLAPPL